MRNLKAGRRGGFTLAEMLLALTLFAALTAIAVGAMSDEVHAFNNGSAQADAATHLRFSMSILDRHLANVGTGVPSVQPQLVYGDTSIVVFNADWMSNIAGDLSAVNADSTLPVSVVTALTKARRITFPTTSVQYPDTSYIVAGSNSPAETVIFWFAADASTPEDDYILWRQVNDDGPEMVARRLIRPSAGPFFRYLRHRTPASGSMRMDSVPKAWMPLRHSVAIHGSNQDTAVLARIDSVRAIEVAFGVTDAQPAPHTRTFQLRRVITLPNAGKEVKKTCGDEPLFTAGMANFVVKDTVDAGGTHSALLRWNRSVDEGAGEKDVMRYVIWRSTSPFSGAVGDPYLSVAAGSANYEYRDNAVLPVTTYYYALAAQDCTPSLSTLRSATVIIP